MAFASLLRNAGVGIVAAVGAVVITFFIADIISGPLMATQPGADGAQEVPLAGAAISTLIGGVVGTVLAFMTSRTARATLLFLAICVVGLVLYGLLAWSAAETTSTGVWLNVMHLAAAVPIVGKLTQWLQAQPAKVVVETADAPSVETGGSSSGEG